MVLKKSSLLNRNEFIVTCQKCPRTERIIPAEIKNSERICKIFGMEGLYIYQCQCGARFNVQFDFRNNSRHASEIGSFYTTLTRSNYVRQIGLGNRHSYKTDINSVIKDISVDGIGFVTNDHHNIEPGDELLVKLIITRGGTERLLERRVVVRSVAGHNIGAEFFAEDKKNPDIGFYLMK